MVILHSQDIEKGQIIEYCDQGHADEPEEHGVSIQRVSKEGGALSWIAFLFETQPDAHALYLALSVVQSVQVEKE
jgi:hypothetical protein